MEKKTVNISPGKVKKTAIAVCVIFTAVLLGLAIASYYKYSARLKLFTQKNSRLIALESDVSDLQNLIQRYKNERQQLEEMLFSDKDIATFLDQISLFANNAKVAIKDMQAQQPQAVRPATQAGGKASQEAAESGPVLYALPINMTVEAEFEHLMGFLISLEKYRQLLTLSDVHITRKTYPLLDCKFTLRLYSLKTLSSRRTKT
ncbi:MAG: hypothetical protein PHO42_02710 [Candidatus Omnitrophica bacterium]|nr:hypothetical protein [Candidatus Omnitrophota bacterium]